MSTHSSSSQLTFELIIPATDDSLSFRGLSSLVTGGLVAVPCQNLLGDGDCWVVQLRRCADGTIQNNYICITGGDAHRQVLGKKIGRLLDEWEVAEHLCGCKACIRPSHLKLGDSLSNSATAKLEGAILKGANHPMAKNPNLAPRGDRNRGTKLSEDDAAEIKWLLGHIKDWHTPRIGQYLTPLEALSHCYRVSVANVRQIQKGATWSLKAPQLPVKFPFQDLDPKGARPTPPFRELILTDANVVDILTGYKPTDDITNYKKEKAAKYGVTAATIGDVLKRKTRRDVLPDIPPIDITRFQRERYDEAAVASIRATYEFYFNDFHKKGLIAAIARRFHIRLSKCAAIVHGLYAPEIKPNIEAIVPIQELEFKDLTQKGETHALAKLSKAQVIDILELDRNGMRRYKIAQRFGVSAAKISQICRGQVWRDEFARFHHSLKVNS